MFTLIAAVMTYRRQQAADCYLAVPVPGTPSRRIANDATLVGNARAA